MSYIEFKNVVKEYKMGEVTIKALDNTNFSIDKGEIIEMAPPEQFFTKPVTERAQQFLNVFDF